tara:strand:+ start:338 stop:661 length:324 start_codon:yes stop_codon:yes gene_type:complete
MTELIKTLRRVEDLTAANKTLHERVKYLESPQYIHDRIDKFVDKWYENNKDSIDIGEVTICGQYKIDLIPDEMEKRMYSKMLKLVNAYYSPPPLPKPTPKPASSSKS